MAVTFAVRGDSLDARFSSAGKSPGLLGTNGPAEVNTDKAGINGSTSIDMEGAFLTSRTVVYNGMENTPSGLDRSMLIRVNFASMSSDMGLANLGIMYRNTANYIGMHATSAGEVSFTVANVNGQADTGTTASAALTTSTWYDILITWTGTTAANGLEIFINTTSRLQDTTTRALPSPFTTSDRLSVNNILIGTDSVFVNAHYSVDELVIWDEIIDPTSVALTSGTGSLSTTRTAYVDVAEFDGLEATGGGGGKSLGNRKGLVV